MDILAKHIKYSDMYQPNQVYWGLGIENEVYLEFEEKMKVSKQKFIENHKRERYSVDYFSSYKSDVLNRAFLYIVSQMESTDSELSLPILMNSHSLISTDKSNNHCTLYAKGTPSNPKFDGKTLSNILHRNEYLKNSYDVNYIYEGDVIEFITLNFFNTTLEDTINELEYNKMQFIQSVQSVFKKNDIYTKYGEINFIKENHPFSILLTNINNIAIFNNGTIHLNITLPSRLDADNKIADMVQFTKEHSLYIKLIQFMEPLIISIYGTPDPFSYIVTNNNKDTFFENVMFSSCSQRCAVSRYIGIGTFDTDTMERGKLLTDEINRFKIATESYGWYNKYHNTSAYNKLSAIGYDINFNKHYNHGIELRFFDHISDIERIKEVFEFIIYLGDFALSSLDTPCGNPITNPTWNDLVVDCMKYGLELKLNKNYIAMYNNIFNYQFISLDIKSLYFEIFDLLKLKSYKNNMFSKYVLANKNKIMYSNV